MGLKLVYIFFSYFVVLLVIVVDLLLFGVILMYIDFKLKF